MKIPYDIIDMLVLMDYEGLVQDTIMERLSRKTTKSDHERVDVINAYRIYGNRYSSRY